jgi:hypothetical protein
MYSCQPWELVGEEKGSLIEGSPLKRNLIISAEYAAILEKHRMVPSMNRPANPYDNASCESCRFATKVRARPPG